MFRKVFYACAAAAVVGLGATGVASAYDGQVFTGPDAEWDCAKQLEKDLVATPGLLSGTCDRDRDGNIVEHYGQWSRR
ncbi:hypothetical protein [Nocardia suismassiliense]|uniref:hypothetical protein n=1 Tax=Nocardia suismassiliense TaxID=2077092 RepID=UPI000D1EBA37|nr:hypothetical protein [Nocardia suismassiliense]